VSLGSGPDADVLFLFTSDICGEEGRRPRHARAYGDLAVLQRRIREERVKALRAFRADIGANVFPGPQELSKIDDNEFEAFVSALGKEL
jgi:3-methyl-2-oxobutanoate hydroxymethyltransferase